MKLLSNECYRDTEGVEPYPFYERVRAMGDVVWDPGMKAWLVVSFELARKVCRDDTLFIHPLLTMQTGIRGDNPRSFFYLQGEQHRAMHQWWVTDLLSPQWVERCKPLINLALETLTAELSPRTDFDLASEYIDLVPISVFAQLLDLPRKDGEFLRLIKSLNDRVGVFVNTASLQTPEGETSAECDLIQQQAVEAANELDDILKPVVRERRGCSGQDFVSRLRAGGPAIFADWNEIDTLDGCRRLIFAGFDAVTHTAANAFHMLLTDAVLMSKVRQGGSQTIDQFAEEALRLSASVQFRRRRATADTELGGTKIRKGDIVVVVLLAANRDPNAFASPHAVVFERTAPRSHLSFFSGPRSCPGAALARSELAGALRHALLRFPSLRLDERAAPPEFKGFLVRSHRPLFVKVDREPSKPTIEPSATDLSASNEDGLCG